MFFYKIFVKDIAICRVMVYDVSVREGKRG